jgi:hypothetical protein
MEEDRLLVERLLAGDQAALRQFFDEYFDRLYRFAFARLRGELVRTLRAAAGGARERHQCGEQHCRRPFGGKAAHGARSAEMRPRVLQVPCAPSNDRCADLQRVMRNLRRRLIPCQAPKKKGRAVARAAQSR